MAQGGSAPFVSSKLWQARMTCLTLLLHDMRRAAARAACTAGSSRATSTPMMAITTSNSTSVNARRGEADIDMDDSQFGIRTPKKANATRKRLCRATAAWKNTQQTSHKDNRGLLAFANGFWRVVRQIGRAHV